jgi:hypothetical protein
VKRRLLGILLVLCAGCLFSVGAWLLDERNRIALDDLGRRTLRDHESVLGVSAGMPVEAATELLEGRGLSEVHEGYVRTQCDGVGTMGHELSLLGYEYRSFSDRDRRPIGGACLLAQDGRVVAMEAYYILYTPL